MTNSENKALLLPEKAAVGQLFNMAADKATRAKETAKNRKASWFWIVMITL